MRQKRLLGVARIGGKHVTREELQSAIQDFWDEKFNHSKHPEISDESKIIAFECMIDEAKRRSTQPPTNADRIRAMDDKELAEFLMECNPANCQQCAFSSGWRCDPDWEDYSDAEKCTEGRKRWLQQPTEEAR